MKIYVASLSDYNAGKLHGSWFDLSDYNDETELLEAIEAKVLETSPAAHEEGLDCAEEFAIHDYDDTRPKGLEEYEDLSYLMEIQDCLNQCTSADEECAFCEWMDETGSTPDYGEFEDAYCGKYDSKEDFAYQYIDDTGMLNSLPEWAQQYFDYDAFSRDLFMGDYVITDSGHVFRAC